MKLKWLWSILITGSLLIGFQIAHSQDEVSTTFIVVMLEDIIFDSGSDESFQVMLGSVVASGSRLQKNNWPNLSPFELLAENSLLPEDTNAIPMFAIREDQLGDQLAITLLALDNQIEDPSQANLWIQQTFPALVEAATGPVALLASDSNRTSETTATRLSEITTPLLDENRLLGLGVFQFSSSEDWGIREDIYQATVEGETNFTISYRISRIEVPHNLEVNITLKSISTVDSQAEVSFNSHAASGFSGESLNQLGRQFPFQGSLGLEAETLLELNEVLLSGPIGPFIFLNLATLNESGSGSNVTYTQLTGSASYPFEVTLTNTALGIDFNLLVEANFIGE